jgi:membrane protein
MFWKTFDFIRHLCRKMAHDDILFLASGIAFNVLACLLPILLFFIYGLGLWFQSHETIRFVDEILETAFPNQPYAHAIRQSISSILAEIVTHRSSLGLLSLVVLMGTSATLFSSLRSVFDRVFEVRHTRHFMISYLADLSLVLGVTLLTLLIYCMHSLYRMFNHLRHYLPDTYSFQTHGILGIVSTLISPILVGLFITLLYRYVPARLTPWRTSILSAIITTIIWETGGQLFSWYLSSLASFSRVYGAYAFIIVLLVWIFYSSVVLIFGAEAGHVWYNRSKPDEKQPAAAPPSSSQPR